MLSFAGGISMRCLCTAFVFRATTYLGEAAQTPRVDTQTSFHIAGKNITDNTAAAIRADASFTPVIYAIGLGGTLPADPIDDTFHGTNLQ